jgi:hypothetical protein
MCIEGTLDLIMHFQASMDIFLIFGCSPPKSGILMFHSSSHECSLEEGFLCNIINVDSKDEYGCIDVILGAVYRPIGEVNIKILRTWLLRICCLIVSLYHNEMKGLH